MAGLPDSRRETLRAMVRETRRAAEAAYVDRLRPLGLWTECSKRHAHSPDCYLIPVAELNLAGEAAAIRTALDAALERESVGFEGLTAAERAQKSVLRYVQGAAYTLLNRLAALRALETRGLVDETVVRRETYGGRSQREYRLAQAEPRLGPDQVLEAALRDGFDNAGRDIGRLFDKDDPYALLLPDPRSLRELLRTFGESITDEDWRADDILGWIYQYYQDEAREAFRSGRGTGSRQAADADQLAAINCLYTPHWVVRALVDNSLGRLLLEQQGALAAAVRRQWTENELRTPSGETVADFCRYLVPPAGAAGRKPAKPLRDIKVLDPACGSGHFLIYAFEVLWRAYRQAEPQAAPEAHAADILEHNLFGIDIDLRACQLAALGLYLKAKEHAPAFHPRALNIICADVRILDGERTSRFLHRLNDDPTLKRIADQLLHDLRYTAEIGSLLRVREPFEALFRARRKAEEGATRLPGMELPRQLPLEGMAPREATIGEIMEALREFERQAIERADMGGHLFASDAERSLGLLSVLSQHHDVVLMNPPYNKRQELPAACRDYLAGRYSRTQNNIYAAFIEQAADMIEPDGFVGMLTPLAYMYLRQLRPLRTDILAEQALPELVLEFGWDILDPAQIQTAGTVLRRTLNSDVASDRRGRRFCDLTAPRGSAAKETVFVQRLAELRRQGQAAGWYLASPRELSQIPGSPYAYWAPTAIRDSFARFPPLDRDNARLPEAEKIADVKQGLATADDTRFLRRWWEVPAQDIGRGKRWAPFVKGEHYARFFHDPSLVVLWANNGESLRNFNRAVIRNPDLYFEQGLTWQLVNANRRCRTRYLPAGCIFAHTGPSVFPVTTDTDTDFALLGLLNSSLCNLFMLVLTPERRWEVGQISLVPIPPSALASRSLSASSQEIYDLLLAWDTGNEGSSRFVLPRLLQVALGAPERPCTGHPLAEGFSWPRTDSWQQIASLTGSRSMSLAELLSVVGERRRLLTARVEQLEREIDQEVFRCYGLEDAAADVLRTLNDRLGLVIQEENEEESEGEDGDGNEQTSLPQEDSLGEVRRLISYYAKQAIENAASEVVPIDARAPGNLTAGVRALIERDWGVPRARQLQDEIHETLGVSLDEWLLYEYFPFHVRLYKNRPLFWLLWSAPARRGRGRAAPGFACFVDFRRLTPDTLRAVRGLAVSKALDDAHAEADRLERQATEQRIAGDKSLAQTVARAQEARAAVEELKRFDQALGQLLQPQVRRAGASWREQMEAAIMARGYTPDRDLGVLVNISPLRDAGVLHPAANRVR